MELPSTQQLQFFVEQKVYDILSHPILQYPLVLQIMSSFFPDFPRNRGKYGILLEQVSQYLLETPDLHPNILTKEFSEEFRVTLYGLKIQLQERSFQQVSNMIENQKQSFEEWLDQALGYSD